MNRCQILTKPRQLSSQQYGDLLFAAHTAARERNLKNEEYERALDEVAPVESSSFVQVGDHDPELRRVS